MSRVCVIGGGTSGKSAAKEAEARGAQVTVVERAPDPDPPWRTWANFASPMNKPSPGSRQEFRDPPIHHTDSLFAEAKSAEPGRVRTADGKTIEADQVVVATGCGFEPVSFPGSRKRGVLILDGVGKYGELRRRAEWSRRLVLSGEGYQAMKVADGQLGEGTGVSVMVTSWQGEGPGSQAMAVLESAASERGVAFLKAPLDGVIGSPSIEGVIVDGKVVPCDALAVLPRRVPRAPGTSAVRGPRGGILVDHTLRSQSAAFHAAGGCSELLTGRGASRTLEDVPTMTGRIAGANCMGEHFSVGPARSQEESVFGVAWRRIGLGPTEARASGMECDTSDYRRDDLSACTVVYERNSGKVLGVEWVDGVEASPQEALTLSSGLSLRALAYWSSGSSSDISLVSETARLGLAQWRRS